MQTPIERLARLEQQRLDEVKRAVSELSATDAALRREIEKLRARMAEEIACFGREPAQAELLARWLQSSRRREQALCAELDRLEHRRAAASAHLHARRIELKRLDLLLARRRARTREAAARAEQRTLDDLAAARHARGRGGGA